MTTNNENKVWFISESRKFPYRMCINSNNELSAFKSIELRMGKFIKDGDLALNGKTKLKKGMFVFQTVKHKNANREYLLKWDFLPNIESLLIANKRGVDFLKEHASGEFQLFDLEIRLPSGDVIKDYKICNITNRAEEEDFIDKKLSILEDREFRRSWSLYKKYYFYKDCIKDNNISILGVGCVQIVSDKFKQAYEQSNLKGLTLESQYGNRFFSDRPMPTTPPSIFEKIKDKLIEWKVL